MQQVPGWRYGWATPIECGRKFCTECGHWRHVVDFQCRRRRSDGSARLTSRCTTCLRLDERRIKSRRDVRERRREYQRIWTAGKRRAAGVPERPIGPEAVKVTESRLQRLDLKPFREAVLASNITTGELARRLKVSERAVPRMLGIVPRTHKDPEYGGLASHISYDNAVKIVLALNLDPVDFGV